jgi:hypothetical protein
MFNFHQDIGDLLFDAEVVTVGGQGVVLDHSRTLAQSGIGAGATLALKSTGLLGGVPTGHPEPAASASAKSAAPVPATPLPRHGADSEAAQTNAVRNTSPSRGTQHIAHSHLDRAQQRIDDLQDTMQQRLQSQRQVLNDALSILRDGTRRLQADTAAHLQQGEAVLEVDPTKSEQDERTQAAEMRALQERVHALEQQLASAAAAAAPATTASASVGVLQVLALQQQVALLACPAASDAPPPAVSPPEDEVLETDPTKSEHDDQDTGNFKMGLRLRIAADPEAFFALADTTQDDSLSPEEWLESCRNSLGNADETECRALFDEMDLDKDERVSREEFIEMRNAIRLFVKDAKYQEVLIEVLAGLVAANWKAGGDDVISVAEKTTEVLTELSVDELHKEVAALLPRRLKKSGDEVKREREERKKKLAALQVEEGESKFAHLPTAAYGDKDGFHKGLEIIGLPHPNTLEELIKECQKKDDSNDEFEAWNSGKNVTNSSKELDFVMDPFESPEGWQE